MHLLEQHGSRASVAPQKYIHGSGAASAHYCVHRTLHEEFKAASKSAALCTLTAVAVGRALALLCQRAAALAAPASELRSLSGAASPAQVNNITLCSQLHEVHRALLMLLPKLAPAAAEVRLCQRCALARRACCESSTAAHQGQDTLQPGSSCLL